MQVSKFSDDSVVAHKIRHIAGSPCKFSAWYSAHGTLKDAERIDALGRSYRPTRRQMTALAMRGVSVCIIADRD